MPSFKLYDLRIVGLAVVKMVRAVTIYDLDQNIAESGVIPAYNEDVGGTREAVGVEKIRAVSEMRCTKGRSA